VNKLSYKYLIYVLVLFLSQYIFEGVELKHISSAFIAGLVLVIVNIIIKPILWLITLPINLITFGLFSFVVNAWMIMLMDKLVGGITIAGFWLCVLIALMITVFNELLLDNKHNYKKEFHWETNN
jgi:putative membrane protein